ncbi:hypothetical protein CJF31_00007196 [Rutstroemia sp. NJR-2017a BVV2]|nr:hypothetical protein CJF31_00007196 [Rutstroemia sp. NJR-2017a BVV2]
MDGHIFSKRNDSNITMCVYATLVEQFDGSEISVHDNQVWAYLFLVPHWPADKNIMLARGDEPLTIGTGYILNGNLSINEGRKWTRTAFEIDDAVPLRAPADATRDPHPQFRMAGLVLRVEDGRVLVGWERYDDDLGNFAWVYAKLEYKAAGEDMRVKKYWFEGNMNGPDRMKDWVVNTANPDL